MTRRKVRALGKASLWAVWAVALVFTIWCYPRDPDHASGLFWTAWSLSVYISVAGVLMIALVVARLLYRLLEGPIEKIIDWYKELPE